MIYIAHRALFNGWDEKNENHPDQIRLARAHGFDCEVDVRLIDGKWFLGHDNPDYEVSDDFIRMPGLWLHCKNKEALFALSQNAVILNQYHPNFFWHDSDDFTLTSNGYIWTYPGKTVCPRMGIRVQPEWEKFWEKNIPEIKGHAVCSKFVNLIRETHTST